MLDTTVKIDSLVKFDDNVKHKLQEFCSALSKPIGVAMAGVRQFDETVALERALDLFWKKGLAATSMQELAAATGVQRGSLYNAYGDKETLFLRVFDLYRTRFVSEIGHVLDRPTLGAALQDYFDFVIGSITRGVPTRGCLSTKTALGGDCIEEPIRRALMVLLDEQETILSERLSRPEPGTQLRLPARQAARLIITLMRGIVVMERVYQDETRLRQTAGELAFLLLEKV
jgi:TetR/AcrR family transcriptional repressor of nem operon